MMAKTLMTPSGEHSDPDKFDQTRGFPLGGLSPLLVCGAGSLVLYPARLCAQSHFSDLVILYLQGRKTEDHAHVFMKPPLWF
jgi:hypothetical protein